MGDVAKEGEELWRLERGACAWARYEQRPQFDIEADLLNYLGTSAGDSACIHHEDNRFRVRFERSA